MLRCPHSWRRNEDDRIIGWRRDATSWTTDCDQEVVIDAEIVVCAPVTKQHNFVPVSRKGLLCGWEGNRGYR